MQENQFTQSGQQVLHEAHRLAMDLQHAAVTEAHLLEALLRVDTQVLPYLFQQNNVAMAPVKAALDHHLKHQAKVEGSTPQLSPAALRCLQQAYLFGQKRNDAYIATPHLLWAVLQSKIRRAKF